MSNGSLLEQVARIHQHAFEHAGRHMQTDMLTTFTGWVATHPEYTPAFSTRLGAAMEWSKQNPEKFSSMVTDFNTALDFLNSSGTTLGVDEATFANIAVYGKHRKGMLLKVGGQDVHNASQILAAARNSGSKLRWGETTKPEHGDYYSFHTFVKSDQGMVAASLTDLYENYTRTLGLYPDDANIDAIVANAITEAAYLTNPDGELFQAYKSPNDEWIYGYDGFSPQFQQTVYGEQLAQ
ncbi:MAG: hypothetical protein WBP26_04610 [Candidatus Saccharimonadales bacterium]